MGSLSKTAKEREPIDSGWGEPDELVRGGDGERAAGSFEDEGYWEGEQAKQGFGTYERENSVLAPSGSCRSR